MQTHHLAVLSDVTTALLTCLTFQVFTSLHATAVTVGD